MGPLWPAILLLIFSLVAPSVTQPDPPCTQMQQVRGSGKVSDEMQKQIDYHNWKVWMLCERRFDK